MKNNMSIFSYETRVPLQLAKQDRAFNLTKDQSDYLFRKESKWLPFQKGAFDNCVIDRPTLYEDCRCMSINGTYCLYNFYTYYISAKKNSTQSKCLT